MISSISSAALRNYRWNHGFELVAGLAQWKATEEEEDIK